MSFYIDQVNDDYVLVDEQIAQSRSLREVFQCILCQYKSSRKSNLKKHFMIHTKEKPFKCNDCTFRAATKSTLVLHVRTHTGERPYECAICQRKFSRRNIIKAHVKTHTNDKPFECTECSFVTSRKDNLKFHMRRHLVEKPFKCHICTCSFVQKCRLKRHLELHTNLFRCFLCCYQTHSEVNLLKHKLSHFKTNSFICFLCGKEFGKKCGIRAHVVKLHSKDERHLKMINWVVSSDNYSAVSQSNKTYSDKAIETENLDENLALFPLLGDISSTDSMCLEESNQCPNLQSNIQLHGLMGSSNCNSTCDYTSKLNPLNEILESTLNLELNPNLIFSESPTPNLEDVPNLLNNVNYSIVDDNVSFGSSSSDSEVDSVKYIYNTGCTDMQETMLEPNPFQNITVLNPDISVNYQPNVNYVMGLNVVQPVVIPTLSLQPSLNATSPLILTSGFNNVQVNQDINFVPICTNTNVFINNLVPNVADTNLMLNSTKTVFVSEMY